MALIIIEGLDNTGKTTAAQKIAELLKFNYVSGGGPEVGTYEGALAKLKEGLPNKVQDRTFISEMIYGPILRGKSGISDQEFMKLMDFLRQNQCILVYARRTVTQILATFDERDQLSGVKEHLHELYEQYDHYMFNKLWTHMEKQPIIYNFDCTELSELVLLIKCWLCTDESKPCCSPVHKHKRRETASLMGDD